MLSKNMFWSHGNSLKSFVEVLCFSLTGYEPVRSHGEPIQSILTQKGSPRLIRAPARAFFRQKCLPWDLGTLKGILRLGEPLGSSWDDPAGRRAVTGL